MLKTIFNMIMAAIRPGYLWEGVDVGDTDGDLWEGADAGDTDGDVPESQVSWRDLGMFWGQD